MDRVLCCHWNGNRWAYKYWTDYGRGGTNIIQFDTVYTRYVLLLVSRNGTNNGVSVYEFGVYNSGSATPPEVLPVDPEKPVDTILPETPLGPTSPEKVGQNGEGEEIVALGVSDHGEQEFYPEPSTYSGSDPDTTDFSHVGVPMAFIESIYWDDQAGALEEVLITFDGSGEDTDYQEEIEQIVEFEWTSSIDGHLSSSATFDILSSQLSSGLHTISFRVRDNEGFWSEPVTDQLTILRDHLFIPLVFR